MYELDAIAACVVGGVSTAGGIGTVPGVAAGAVLTYICVDLYWQMIIKGLIIVAWLRSTAASTWPRNSRSSCIISRSYLASKRVKDVTTRIEFNVV